MNCMRSKTFLLAMLSLFSLTSTAWADDGGLDDVTEFDIPAQPLEAALIRFSEQADLQLVMASATVDGKEAAGVRGEFVNRTVLDNLLAGTGLAYQSVDDRTVTISETSANTGKFQPASNSVLMAQNQTPASRNQTSRNSETRRDDAEPALDVIVVVGTNIRGVDNPTNTVITLDRVYIDKTGFSTTEELITSLPQNIGAGSSRDTFTDTARSSQGISFTGGSSINLRGLGTNSTLVLLNGRRISASGAQGDLVDVSMIPLTAIERVEVLTDGASAIYGADAIAGVVNFVMRDDFDGAETRLRYGSVSSGGLDERQFGQIIGKSWNSGNTLLSYEYFDRGNLQNSERSFAADSDLRRFGGDNFSSLGGNPANILANGETYAIPAGQDGTGLTPADFVAGTQNFFNLREGGDLIPEQESHSVFATIFQDFSSQADGFFEARYTNRETTALRHQNPVSFDVTDQNPFFVDPLGTGLSTVEVEGYSFFDELGARVDEGTTEQYGAATGINVEFSDRWSARLHGNYVNEESESLRTNFVNRVALADALVQDDPQLAFNPFADGANNNQQVINSLRTGGDTASAESELWSVNLIANGTLFSMPGGDVEFAGGLEYRDESLSTAFIEGFDVENPTEFVGLDQSRNVTAAFAELLLPFVNESNARPGMTQFQVSLAVRYEEYSDFGDSTNPRIGMVWSPHNSLNIRATYGTSFKAPLLAQLDTSSALSNVFFFVPGAFAAAPALFLIGGNPDLDAEESTTWTTGLEYVPGFANGLRISATYFDIDFDGRIASRSIPGSDILEPQFAPLVTLMPPLDLVAQFANSPLYQDFFGVPAADLISGDVPVGAIVDGRLRNISRSVVRGVDLEISQDIDSRIGEWFFALNGSYLIDFKEANLITEPLVEFVDTVRNPTSLRLRGSGSWTRNNWSSTVFVNHTGSYTDNLSDPERSIDSWTTVDAQLSYDFADRARGDWLRGTRINLSVQNLFDEDPPFVNTDGGLAYDSANADGLGRFASLQLTKDW